MLMNLVLEINLDKSLKLTTKNNTIRFKDDVVGKILKYNKKTGLAKIEITNSITARRIMKSSPIENNTLNFLNYDINTK